MSGSLHSSGTLADYAGHSVLDARKIDLARPGTAFRLLLHLAMARSTGIVGVKTPKQTIAISVSGGQVTKTSSNLEDDNEALAFTLMQSELLPRDRLLRVAEHVDSTGESLARSLFSMQLLTAKQMVKAMKEMHSRHLRDAMEAKDATFTFVRSDILVTAGTPIGATSVRIRRALNDYMRQKLRTIDHPVLAAMLAPLRGKYLRVPDSIIVRAGGLGFNKRELHTMQSQMDGSLTMDEILRQSVMSKNAAIRHMFQMACLGFIELLDESTKPKTVLSDADKLEAKLVQLEKADLFTRLDAHWTTPALQIKKAYEGRVRDYGPGGRYNKSPDAAAVCRRIMALMDSAWETLKKSDERRKYRSTLIEEVQIRFSGDLLYAQGQTAEFQNEYDKARELYETAMELYPNPKAQKALAALDAREADWRKRLREKEQEKL